MKKGMEELPDVGVFTGPIYRSGAAPISNLITILSSLSDNIYLITGEVWNAPSVKDYKKIHTYTIKRSTRSGIFSGIANHIRIELEILHKVIALSKGVDFWICFMGDSLILPILAPRLLGKKVILVMASDYAKPFEMQKDILLAPLRLLLKINLISLSKIIVYSKNHIDEWGLERYRDKVSIAHEHFLDVDTFRIQKKLGERSNTVGYIGRLSVEKGILDFIDAIPKVLTENNRINIFICGDGDLFNEVKQFAGKNKFSDKIKFLGWVPHEELPEYLNELKLLVLPSYTEGLPNIIIEAMACGTPVLATPVGAIPDLIRDGKTGFILENNSPECIAENVIRALEDRNLDEIVKNASKLIEEEYTYRAAVEQYRKILATI